MVGSDLLADAVIFSIAKTNQGDPGPDPSSGDIIIDRDSGVVTVDPAQTNIFGQTFYTVTMTGKGNYKDSKTVDIHIAVDDPNGPVITGDFDYIIPTSITYGEAAKTIDVTINQNITGTDVRYDIKNPIQGITIDSVSGQLTINSTLGLGSHNIIIAATSTGTQGEIERSFTTSVSRRSLKNIQGFSLNYLDQTKTARTGDTISSGLINNVNLTAGTDYILYITPPAGITSPGKLTINNDGTITIPSTVTVNDRGTYTIEAQGLGNYTESVTDIFTLTLEKRSITNWVNLMYSDKGVTAKTPTTISRDSDGGLQGLIPGTDLTFTISGPSSKVSIASDTGEITIPGTITTSDGGSYTVTAAGENDYKDTQTDTFSLAVSRKDIGSITFSLTPNSGGVKASIASTIQTAITNDGGLAAGRDYDIAYITPPSSTSTTEVTIDSNGVIGIGSGIVDNDAGDYIVTFTGKGEYMGWHLPSLP